MIFEEREIKSMCDFIKKNDKEMRNCTFKPEINKRSSKIIVQSPNYQS